MNTFLKSQLPSIGFTESKNFFLIAGPCAIEGEQMAMDIAGKVAIVTGGASGLGEATVRLYVSLGAKVAVFDMNDERGSALVAELGDAVIYQSVNVSDEAAVQGAMQLILAR